MLEISIRGALDFLGLSDPERGGSQSAIKPHTPEGCYSHRKTLDCGWQEPKDENESKLSPPHTHKMTGDSVSSLLSLEKIGVSQMLGLWFGGFWGGH